MNIIRIRHMHKLTITLFISLFSVPALAATSTLAEFTSPLAESGFIESGTHVDHILLAESGQEQDATPEPGSLVIPGETRAEDKDKKQCLNVCKKWGEDCIINPRTGARTCRRTCKEFGEECF